MKEIFPEMFWHNFKNVVIHRSFFRCLLKYVTYWTVEFIGEIAHNFTSVEILFRVRIQDGISIFRSDVLDSGLIIKQYSLDL